MADRCFRNSLLSLFKAAEENKQDLFDCNFQGKQSASELSLQCRVLYNEFQEGRELAVVHYRKFFELHAKGGNLVDAAFQLSECEAEEIADPFNPAPAAQKRLRSEPAPPRPRFEKHPASFTTARDLASPSIIKGPDSKGQAEENHIQPRERAAQQKIGSGSRSSGQEDKLVELIKREIQHKKQAFDWDDIAGLEQPKKVLREIVVWPMLRPDIFYGLRGPPKGILLFGPPGTGKTLIGKCIASQAGATFFSISASSLTSKWVGEGEKMVRILFDLARASQPSVIFIDEIDSLLSARSENEAEGSRRIKTEFLVQFDGVSTDKSDRLLVIGATNRPQEIDEAARRRLVRRLYIPLPEKAGRISICKRLLMNQNSSLTEAEFDLIGENTDGYSGSDMDSLCREAAIGPIRTLSDISKIDVQDVRPIMYRDFEEAYLQVRASVGSKDLDGYVEWNKQYGCL